jgi:hypothetical protein
MVACCGGVARAEDSEGVVADVDRPAPSSADATPARATVASGGFLSLTQAASLEGRRAAGIAVAGVDSARDSASAEVATEARLGGPVVLRAGVQYGTDSRQTRPSVGLRAQLLSEGRHGVDGAVGAVYKPEGLTEPEGEVEASLAVARHLGSIYAIGNVVYGQDPEGNERDGELRLAALAPVGSHATLGFDGRARIDLGSRQATLMAHHEATFDLLAGPSASVLVGPVALLVQAGASAVTFHGESMRVGAFGLLGGGAAF